MMSVVSESTCFRTFILAFAAMLSTPACRATTAAVERASSTTSAAEAANPKATWIPAATESNGGARIAYYVAGGPVDGTVPLVVVSGGPGSDHRYMRIGGAFARMARSRPVVMFDQRSTGRSTPAGPTPDFLDWARDVDAIRKALGVSKIDLLGHSFGGLVAMAYAKAYPTNLASVILVDSTAPRLADNKQLLAEMYPDRIDEWRAQRAALPRRFEASQIRVFFSMEFSDPDLIDMYTAAVSGYTYDIAVNNALRAQLREVDYTESLQALPVPALIVHGRHDAVLSPSVAAALQRLIPKARLKYIEQSGHLPFVEQPEAFVEAVHAFLAESRRP